MMPNELKELCARWNKSPEGFTQIVRSAIGMLYQRELAAEFEVAVSTVSRWASGTARPHTRIQKLIVAEIEKRARRADHGVGKGRKRGSASPAIAAKPGHQ
jgi:DNA-binding transcriptional regulator YiaG